MSKIVVVDLDGCLCSINTFRYWLVLSYLFLLFSFRWMTLIKFNKHAILRVFFDSDRVKMKRDILSITEDLPEYFVRWFCRLLSLFVNRDVLLEMQKYEAGHIPVVLCTAAPACYVNVFAKNFNFSQVFATLSIRVADWRENIGAEKVKSVETYYGKDVVLDCVITDHHDDLPLLLRAKKRLLVKPSKATLDVIIGRFDFDVI